MYSNFFAAAVCLVVHGGSGTECKYFKMYPFFIFISFCIVSVLAFKRVDQWLQVLFPQQTMMSMNEFP